MARRPTPQDLHREANRRSTGGKQQKAPCGHPGETVIGTYVRCLHGCDGEAAAPHYIRPEETKPICLHTTGTLVRWSARYQRSVMVCCDCEAVLKLI